MNFYFKHRMLGAIFIEISSDLGVSPLYSFSKWQNEHILDFPWARFIMTPASKIKEKTENIQNGDETTDRTLSADHRSEPVT
jgi:hypothetical protein